jgi:hypothetical protein
VATFIGKQVGRFVCFVQTRWGKAFRQRLTVCGKLPLVVIGNMMWKLIHVAFSVLKSGKSFDSSLHFTWLG